ncbi:energy transducer TonB [Niastella vici]|uniref:Energy transducer TonB n=1 Tax=Niastella vici TaxID=1703345 RepID=A0A1V9FRV5_9BACT|nr:energy transducer TonB [Niastella vici]OQP61058.1 energy transducer TonB [Niastella vici]
MESSTILTADVLDIIFEGRNKEYGAYDLRRTYSKRLTVSITVMLSAIGIVTMSFAFTGKKTKTDADLPEKVIELASVEQPQRPVEPPPPPPVKPPAPPAQVKMAIFVAPVIVQDDQVKPDEMPPANETLENLKIGNKNVPNGVEDDGTIMAPPGDGNVVTLPQKEEEDWEGTWTKVEIPSEYPGGPAAWQRYLNRNLHFSQEAIDNEVEGTVEVQFIVDKEGNVSDVEAINGPMELRAEAVRVIKKSGRWTPAIQNGHQVKTLKKQPIIFRLEKEG